MKFDRIQITFILVLFYKPMKEGRKPEHPEKNPDDELQKCHILKPKNSSPN